MTGAPNAGAEYEVVVARPRGLGELTVRVAAVPGLPADHATPD